jgi:hypothetical protein
VEHGKAFLDVSRTAFSLRHGSQGSRERVALDDLGGREVEVPPGSETVLRVPLDLGAGVGVDYVEVEVQGRLFPLRVHFEDEPERFSPIVFPVARGSFVPEELLGGEGGLANWEALPKALEGRSRELLALSMMLAEQDRIRLTDWLVGVLPGPNLTARATLLACLHRVTGENLGDDVARWRSWWASESGARWAARSRRDHRPLEVEEERW